MSEKYDGEIADLTVTQTALGRYLKLSQQRISQMLANGELIRDEFDKRGRVKLADSLKNYFLSKNTGGDEASYWKEKALREQINRKRDALKLQKEDGTVYEANVVEEAFADLVVILRTQLLGLPNKLAPVLEGKSREEIYSRLNSEIEECLTELSNFDSGQLAEKS